MFSVSALSYIVLGLFSGLSILKILSDKGSIFVTLLLNIIFGGFLYAFLNILKVDLPFNFLSASCITILGAPGVILLALLKIIFKVF